MSIKPKFGYYPASFDLEKFCTLYNLLPNKVVKILNLFIIKPLGQEDNRAINLNSVLLRKSVGDVYKRIIECLIDNGVIEKTSGYVIGSHSKAFQLTDKFYYSDGIKKHSIENSTINQELQKKNAIKLNLKYIADLKLPKAKRTALLPDVIFAGRYRSLIRWFKDDKLSIDTKKAYSIISNLNFKELEPHKYIRYMAIVDIFNNKDYHLKSDKNQRFYSSITNLPKVLRGCLLYNGEELIGTDVSNTQPLLLSNLCNINFLKQLKKDQNIVVNNNYFNDFIKHLGTFPKDLVHYKELVESGKLYESFVDIESGFTREIVKDNLVKIINDKGYNNTREKKHLRETLKKRFPTISMLLDLLKSVDHHYVSSALISMEAQNFVINFPAIFYTKEANRNIPLFTIHDCFMTTKSNIDYLENEIKNYFFNNLSIDLPLKREVYM